jgi:two-component system cell cycle response regulator
MIDVDYFKKFNDRYGHLEGDKVLVELSARLSANLREVDTIARYGGEEFAVLLPNTNLQEAGQVADKLREVVRQLPVNQRNGNSKKVTVSVGVATFEDHLETTEDFINHADIALYHAKAGGRDKVKLFSKKEPPSLRAVE